jgi:lipoyl(octanoyl) transferase
MIDTGTKELQVIIAGITPYPKAVELQHDLIRRRGLGIIPDTLLLIEHPAVYTVGRNAEETKESIEGVPVYRVDRGGKTTFHGPGQLVAYPIIDLAAFDRDIRRYVRWLEETVIDLLRIYGLEGMSREGYPGVWVRGRKIAATGVRVNKSEGRWIVSHGIALNIVTDLSFFKKISPCGMDASHVTTLYRETGIRYEWREMAEGFAERMKNQMNNHIRRKTMYHS